MSPQSGREQVKVELFDKDMDKDDFLGRSESNVELSSCAATGDLFDSIVYSLMTCEQ